MVKKAVLVGINYKGTNAQLNGCINDIERMRDLLISQYQYLSENIILLRDDSSDIALLPTRENILKHFYNLTHDTTVGLDEIWFHYSGHGSQVPDRNGDEADRLDEVIVPMDYMKKGMITDDEIFMMVKDVTYRSIIIFDSCHSGSMCDLEYGVTFDPSKNRFFRFQNSTKKTTNPHIISISGCRDYQTSADAYSAELKMGVGAFTDSMITVLKQNNYGGHILYIYQETCKLIAKTGFTQMPILSSSVVFPDYKFIPSITTASIRNIDQSSIKPSLKRMTKMILSTPATITNRNRSELNSFVPIAVPDTMFSFLPKQKRKPFHKSRYMTFF